MGDKSSIEWTDSTWNPVAGCNLVSAGCSNCYAMKTAARLEAIGLPQYVGTTKKVNGKPVWTGKVNMVESALALPMKWNKSRRVFVNSMSDLFHEAVPFDYIDQVMAITALCPQHTFQILTKRHERMAEYFREMNGKDWPETGFAIERIQDICVFKYRKNAPWMMRWRNWPLPNVILGVSVEDQANAARRLPALAKLRQAGWTTMASYEPALGPVDWEGIAPAMDWLVVGGESGPGARPFDVDWARRALAFCRKHDVAPFIKQMGAKPYANSGESISLRDSKGGDMDEWADDLRVREFPKRKEVTA